MPRTRSLAWSELKIGVLTIVAIVIAAVTIFMLTGGRGFFWQRYTLKTRFPNVAGLKPGSPVRVAGVRGRQRHRRSSSPASRSTSIFEVNKELRDRITDRVDRDARVGVAARRRARSTSRRRRRARRFPSGATCRPGARRRRSADITDQASQGDRRAHRLVARRPRRAGHGRQADDRRPALRRAAAVRRDAPDELTREHPAGHAARSASC